jgi:nucleoside-diphosphate-sugar epimerase
MAAATPSSRTVLITDGTGYLGRALVPALLARGHRWPAVLIPIYALLRWVPATRASAERLGFVTLAQMTRALVNAVEQPASGVRVVEVPEIRVS